MRCLGFVFLLAACSLSAQTSVVPDIQYRSVPDFLRMPADLYFGEVSGVAGLHICAGFSGMGFKISPAIGLVMSELLLEGRGKIVDISSFCPGRFAAGKPIKAEFEYKDD